MSAFRHPHLSILLLAWFTADLLMPVLIRLSRRFRWLDLPYGHKTHREPTPVLGGVGVYLAMVAGMAFILHLPRPEPLREILGIFIGATLVMGLGMIDDFRPINAVIKLVVLAVATLVIASFGVCVSIFPGGDGNPLNLLITLLWVTGVTSATNSLDHVDGATAGSTAIACGTIFIIAWGDSAETSQSWLSYLSLAMGGGCLGFLRHNLAGGKIFLGDNGSFLLGFLLASCLVFARWSEDPLKALILPGVVLTVPLFDIALSTILRLKNGVVGSMREAIVYCGKDHLGHRLAALGLGKRATTVAIYSLGIVSGAFAIAIKGLESRPAYLAVFTAYLALLLVLGAVLDRAPVHPGSRGNRREVYLPPRLCWPAQRTRRKTKAAAR
jgi:UDP-GlcNAc:undecaprenyl-phosphate GlcNAc-1-phosphate transferase